MVEFKVKDTVLSFDNGMLYEAKIMKIQEYGKERKYFIHYNGWARKYDMWMDEDQLADKSDPLAVERLKEAAREKLLPTGKRGKTSAPKQAIVKIGKQKIDFETVNRGPAPASTTASNSSSAMAIASTERVERLLKEKKSATLKGIELISFDAKTYQKELLQKDLIDQVDDEVLVAKIKLTMTMKRHLLDDWNLITKEMNNRLIRLPKSYNQSLTGIFEDFLAVKRKQLQDSGNERDEETNFTIKNYEDFFRGLRIQFNRALPALLLFRQERSQFDALSSAEILKGKSYSDIYGADHLIRFLVRMPNQLCGVILQKEALNSIFDVINQLISFLETDHASYLSVLNYNNRSEAFEFINNVTNEFMCPRDNLEDNTRGKRNKKKRNFDDI
jgi:mortality factor 4-like protein 1